MADERAHLARGEIEDRPVIRVVDIGPLGPLDDGGLEGAGAGITDQVLVG